MTVDDYVQVQQLNARYNLAIDTGDVETWVGCFADTGEFAVASGENAVAPKTLAVGSEQLATLGAAMSGNPDARGYHWSADPVVTLTDKGATATSHFLFVMAPGGRSEISVAGHFDDVLVRAGNQWLLQRRVLHTPKDFGDG